MTDQPQFPPVWAGLVGQESAVQTLRRAVGAARKNPAAPGAAMSHAWLITGPPGSGRSNAAKAFAAALLCEMDVAGCGQCRGCRSALAGSHPDVTLLRTEMLSIGVAEVRELVRRAAMAPTVGGHQILVVEDADRVTERGADALLKSIEEPAPRTVWLLCAPTADDVVITIRSRCRLLTLATPRTADITDLLINRDGVAPELAGYAARAAQGHVGRARALGTDEVARARRDRVLRIPDRLTSLSECLSCAVDLVAWANEEAATAGERISTTESAELNLVLSAAGGGTRGKAVRTRGGGTAQKDLAEQQKLRLKRLQRDALDRGLTELTSYYRDVLACQLGAASQPQLINEEHRDSLMARAKRTTAEATLRKIDGILACRTALETNVAPQLAVEAMLLKLAR